MPVPQTPTTPRCLWACGRDRVPLRPRLLDSQAGDDASTKETASSLALMSQSAIVLYVPTPQMFSHWQAAACPRAARKSATYRNPRSPILAALVPSVGTMMLQIKKFGSRAGAHERPGTRASLTDPWSHRRARKFERHNDRASICNKGRTEHFSKPVYRHPASPSKG
jgi:hypothetical protein